MVKTISVFSWFDTPLQYPEKICSLLNKYKITHLYQMVSPKLTSQQIQYFLKVATNYQLTVYFLIGEAEWALDPESTEAVRLLDGYKAYSGNVEGVVVDIEPYLLSAFKKSPKEVMRSFVQTLEVIYKKAKQLQLKVIVCLPYFFDTIGFDLEIDRIIGQYSDTVAIMNYYRDHEMKHIQTEAKLASKYRKPIPTASCINHFAHIKKGHIRLM